MQHTPEQAAVIASPPGNLLVSAAAGSGKTAVLTDRIVSRIIAGDLDVRGVLVMTFTEAAARNMKDKIESKLRAALGETREPGVRQRINRQLSLLSGAAISTIHAFCLDVIRNFYPCAKDDQGQPLIEPGFRVDDGIEADLLLRLTLDEVLAEQYETIDRANAGEDDADFSPERQFAFYRLIDGYGNNGGDLPVRELILNLHHFLRSLPDYQSQIQLWLDGLRAAAVDFSASPHMAALLRMLRLLLDRALDQLDEMEGLLAGGIQFIKDANRNQAYQKQFDTALQTLRRLDAALNDSPDWDGIRALTAGLTALELPRANKADSPEKQDFMALFCQTASEVIHGLSGACGTQKCRQHFIFKTQHIFNLSAAEIEADIAAQLPAVDELFSLVLGLDREYDRRKKIAGMIDFSDFEHLALAILRQDEARLYYRGRFAEVYVDEYQDTSSIQEEIIRAVSDNNCIMVGDIKQSIYRFRHARPSIFISRAQAYQSGEAGVLHELNMNFRSVAGILAAANDLFEQIMSTGAGEIDYDERHALKPHRPDAAAPQPVTLLLINRQPAVSEIEDEDDEQDESPPSAEDTASDEPDAIGLEDLNRYQQEALAIAHTMRQLNQQGTAWQDMVVLSRTRSIGQVCRDQLESLGISVQSDMAASFLDSPVMRQLEALLHLLDNLRQDIPLAAVLRAEVCQGGFADEELLQIRLFAREQRPDAVFFHQAVLAYAADGPDTSLRARLTDTLYWLGQLREQEQILSIGELIGLIFDQSGWLDRLAAYTNGSDEIRHLRQFQQWAEQFEARRPRGLHAFVGYIDSLRTRGSVDSPFAAADAGEDAVRIMTIHSSKGLEFKVVFLMGTGYDLTPKDSNDALLISETLGLGMDFADPELQVRYPTHLKLAMIEELKAAGLAEELRLLYVAMTRAMDRLYIVGSVKLTPGKADKHLAALLRQARVYDRSRQLPDYLVLAGKCYLDWLFMALARQPGLDLDWLETGEFPVGETGTPIWRLEMRQFETLQIEAAAWARPLAQPTLTADPATLLQSVLAPGTPEIDDLTPALRRCIVDPYRFELAARTPIKLTVSELKRREQAVEIDLGETARGISLTLHEWSPQATEAGALAADQLGTLLHAFFRYLDLPTARRQPDLTEIHRQLAAMQQAGMFSDIESAALAGFAAEFLTFVQSELAAQMTQSKVLHEEIPFTLALPAAQVYNVLAGLAPEDQALVQGIIDCWFEQDDGITLVDYKSDRLPTEPLLAQLELQARYSGQLNYYARAIQAATGKPVARRLIWLIRQGRAVELSAPEENQ